MGLVFIGWKNRAILFITEISSQNVPRINCVLAHVIKSDFRCLFWQSEGCQPENSSCLCISEWIEYVGFGSQQLFWIAQTANWLSTCELLTCPYKTTRSVAVPWMVPNGNMGLMVYSGFQVWDLNRKLGLQNVLFSMLLTFIDIFIFFRNVCLFVLAF